MLIIRKILDGHNFIIHRYHLIFTHELYIKNSYIKKIFIVFTNILLLTQFFTPTIGGGELVFHNLAKTLADKGNHVWVIANRIKGESYLKHKNIKIIFVPPLLEHRGGFSNKFSHNILYCFWTVMKTISIIKKEKIQIIHSNNFAPALSGSILSFLTSKPHITVIHDIFSIYKDYWKIERKQKNVPKLNSFIGPIFEKMIIKLKCSAIHTVSDATKLDLIKFGAKKPIYVIPNAIFFDEPKTYDVNPLQFIFIGRLIHYKNVEVVIKAVGILKKKYPTITLIIVGSGPFRENLERLVSDLNLHDNIKFKGQLKQEEKNEWLKSSLSIVFPSLLEGFGLVILEAFEFKKPVLVANISPLSDIVDHGKTGFVISPQDEKEWAKSMEMIIKEPEKAVKMGESGRKVLEEKYDPKSMCQKVMNMYEDLIRDD